MTYYRARQCDLQPIFPKATTKAMNATMSGHGLPVIVKYKIPVPKIAAINAYTKTAKASFIGSDGNFPSVRAQALSWELATFFGVESHVE
jgi:hypothetical protein